MFGHIEAETKVTSDISTELHGLQKHANNSVQVWAYTHVGDGVKSSPIFCVTDEAAPEPPSKIKVVVSSPTSLIVSWMKPARPNGVLISYGVYWHVLKAGQERDLMKRRLLPTHTHYEVRDLHKGEAYEFWVTASTRVGEGQSTLVVYATISNRVPAVIISFGEVISVRRRGSVQLPCIAVGIPPPERLWLGTEGKSITGEAFSVHTNGSLHIMEIQRQHQGNYTCSVSNANGSDEIVYFVRVLEYAEDISPYATFHVQGQGQGQQSPFSPGHIQTFVYHDHRLASMETMQLKSTNLRDDYSKLRANQKGKSKRSESCDYSSSADRRSNLEPIPPRPGTRGERLSLQTLLYQGPSSAGEGAGPESSTSPEASPLPNRRNLARRHRHNVRRRDTSLSLATCLDPPTGFSGGHELSEAECDMDTIRRLKRSNKSIEGQRPSRSHSCAGQDYSQHHNFTIAV